jgi:hypothetical protein
MVTRKGNKMLKAEGGMQKGFLHPESICFFVQLRQEARDESTSAFFILPSAFQK